MRERQILCIDLKSFYASVECVERGLDSMKARLVVADPERTDKTICLAVSPALKELGVKNRCRVFEIPDGIDYITATPRMQKYIDYAAEIYGVYLEFVSKDDIHTYSIDEVFMDVTHYLPTYKLTARELAKKIIGRVYERVGIRATCGIGTNLYLAKIALDITAKHADDFIGELDEKGFIEQMWHHRPLTDFWRIGKGTAERLESRGIFTMEDIAKAPEEVLYKLFGIDAELLIDHAWGREPTAIEDIKAYNSKTNCITSGQVLMCDYNFEDGEIIVREMMDALCLELFERGVVTDSITMYVGYSNELDIRSARGSASVDIKTNADYLLIPAAVNLYRRIVDSKYPVRRINITCNRVSADTGTVQLDMFNSFALTENNKAIQNTMLKIKKRFGKNAIIKGTSLRENATGMERNRQIGGHKSG